MDYRILSCGESLENYYICTKKKVAGFMHKTVKIDDVVYFAVKVEGVRYCGARGVLGEVIDFNEWADGKEYRKNFRLASIEYCEPFELNSVLSSFDKRGWYRRFVQNSKPIQEQEVIDELETLFNSRKIEQLHEFQPETPIELASKENINTESTKTDENEPDEKIKVMATYEVDRFISETHPTKGIEVLVNENFFDLFDEYEEEYTIFIKNNRKFTTSSDSTKSSGISGIPDGVIVRYSKLDESPLQINIVEYECYGEGKLSPSKKADYLSSHIIPQLIRFSSAFSVVTDNLIRTANVERWTSIISDYVMENENEKMSRWLKLKNPNIHVKKELSEFEKMVKDALQTNIRVLLIIDELTPEQNDTIKNVINSFKLANGNSVGFRGYVVKLQQLIKMKNTSLEYALSVQKYI